MTDRYALIGNPVAHSKSPMIHAEFAKQTGQDLSYEAIEAPVDGFKSTVDAFRAKGGRGVNVTLPFKLEAAEYATELSERARLAGAVNCMKFEDGSAVAENYDGMGLVNDIQRNLGFPMRGRRVLLLGAGGAARGALLPFLEQGPSLLFVANRTISKAKALGERFAASANLVTGGYDDLGTKAFDIVVNATSASLRGELPPVPRTAFAQGCLAYDLVYGKGLTPFLRLARDAGAARVADGIGMLVEQAAEAFVWWRGTRPETRAMISGLSVPLA
ncbi:MAG TPA: shikimate dehydrogenase [Casimicrobiaceae bacterium]|nr:shikimate dehydrogenase [Casimicrobiaceae bacterium]